MRPPPMKRAAPDRRSDGGEDGSAGAPAEAPTDAGAPPARLPDSLGSAPRSIASDASTPVREGGFGLPLGAWELGGRYEATVLLGRGSYGEVAEGAELSTGRKVWWGQGGWAGSRACARSRNVWCCRVCVRAQRAVRACARVGCGARPCRVTPRPPCRWQSSASLRFCARRPTRSGSCARFTYCGAWRIRTSFACWTSLPLTTSRRRAGSSGTSIS